MRHQPATGEGGGALETGEGSNVKRERLRGREPGVS